jgi:hypothetical protein
MEVAIKELHIIHDDDQVNQYREFMHEINIVRYFLYTKISHLIAIVILLLILL